MLAAPLLTCLVILHCYDLRVWDDFAHVWLDYHFQPYNIPGRPATAQSPPQDRCPAEYGIA